MWRVARVCPFFLSKCKFTRSLTGIDVRGFVMTVSILRLYMFTRKTMLYREVNFQFVNVAGNRGFSIGIGDVTPGHGLLQAKDELLRNG